MSFIFKIDVMFPPKQASGPWRAKGCTILPGDMEPPVSPRAGSNDQVLRDSSFKRFKF